MIAEVLTVFTVEGKLVAVRAAGVISIQTFSFAKNKLRGGRVGRESLKIDVDIKVPSASQLRTIVRKHCHGNR